ncbi:septation protein SepH [Pseudonocardia sp. GCM10023141]|uniref:septation protein SepH n=1 Tax=Pseudonocardia sp. GCM10023141 TaxID=3252653 RepID=UPI00361BA4A9
MRALRVVGITEDDGEISVVLEDSGRRERFTVAADEQLRAAARGDLTRLGQISIELESQLRPREIQARIRAGASVDQVASAAGVPQAKIERFAYPVLLERSRTAEVAQRAHPLRADGPDTRMLGDVVAHTFGLRGQEYTEAEWDSWKGEDGRWIVALSWRAGRSDNRAHWTFQPGAHGGTVTAVDEHASDLVEGLPARPLRTVGPVIDIARPDEPAPAPAPLEELRATADSGRTPHLEAPRAEPPRAAEPSRPTAPTAFDTSRSAPVEPPRERPEPTRPEVSRPEVSRPEPARTETDRPAARTAAPEQRRPAPPAQRQSEPAPQVKAPPVTAQPVKAPVKAEPATPVPAEPATPVPAEPQPEVVAEAPAAEPAPVEQPEPAPAASRRTKKGKPVMPSWDEVLLGVRGQR